MGRDILKKKEETKKERKKEVETDEVEGGPECLCSVIQGHNNKSLIISKVTC